MNDTINIRVYYEDTDASGVVHHATYVRFFERGRTEWLRQLGFEQRTIAANDGILFAVRRLKVDYKQAAVLDDALWVKTTPLSCRRTSVLFSQQLGRGERELATAEVLIVCVSANPFRVVAIPDALAKQLNTMIIS